MLAGRAGGCSGRRLALLRPGPAAAAQDPLNLSRVRVDAARAKLSCHPHLDVTTDGPLTVKLRGCRRKLSFG
jgi:hypothetical protein